MSFQGDVPGLVDFAFAAFVASNHIQDLSQNERGEDELSRPPILRALDVLRAPKAIQALKFLKIKEPTMDAICQLLFKEALLSEDVNLTEILLKNLDFNMADLIPGPWPWDFYLQRPPSVPSDPRPPLQVAIETKNYKLVQVLLNLGADVNVVGAGGYDMPTAATYTCSKDIFQLLYLLLKNFQGERLPCFLACLTHGFLEVANYLWPHVRSSVSGQKDFETEALVEAVEAGHVPIVKDLLQDGANPNTMDERGTSPLHVAAASSSKEALETVKILVEWDAELDSRLDTDRDRMPTPLQIAAQQNHFEIATFLINEGADPNAEPIMDYTQFLSEE